MAIQKEEERENRMDHLEFCWQPVRKINNSFPFVGGINTRLRSGSKVRCPHLKFDDNGMWYCGKGYNVGEDETHRLFRVSVCDGLTLANRCFICGKNCRFCQEGLF